MLRTFSFVCLMLAAFSPTVSLAQTVIPHEVNIHNGVIEVRNHIHAYYALGTRVTSSHIWVFHGNKIEDAYVPSEGGLIFLYHCCYAAGSEYEFYAYTGQGKAYFYFRPQLCNLRGIPFGYAVIELSGTLRLDIDNRLYGETHVKVVPAPCPDKQAGY